MNTWTPTDRRIGMWSATSVAVIGIVYVATGAIGIFARPPGEGLLRQVDPYLAILEFLIILSAVALVVMMAAVHAYAAPETKTFSLTSLSFMVAFATITCITHFASLTVGRQQSAAMPQLAHHLSFGWLSVALALDLLAWDFFLGFSLLFAAPVFRGDRLQTYIRRCTLLAGALCLAGTFGPLLHRIRIQFLAIVGYAFVLPLIAVLVAVFFKRLSTEQRNLPARQPTPTPPTP